MSDCEAVLANRRFLSLTHYRSRNSSARPRPLPPLVVSSACPLAAGLALVLLRRPGAVTAPPVAVSVVPPAGAVRYADSAGRGAARQPDGGGQTARRARPAHRHPDGAATQQGAHSGLGGVVGWLAGWSVIDFNIPLRPFVFRYGINFPRTMPSTYICGLAHGL